MTEWTDIVSIIRGYAAISRTRTRTKKSMNATLRTLLAENEGETEGEGDVVVVVEDEKPTALTKRSPAVRPSSQDRQSSGVASILHWPVHVLQAFVSALIAALNGTFLMPILHVTALAISALFAAVAAPLSLLRFLLSPFLVLLHVIFTLSSIVLRALQTRPDSPRDLTQPAPEHVALILVDDGGEPHQLIVERWVESVRRAILWAAEWGVRDLTVWDTAGLGVRFHSAVTHSLLNLPPSPPSSSPSPRTSSDNDTPAHLGDDTVSSSVYVNSRKSPPSSSQSSRSLRSHQQPAHAASKSTS